MLFKPTHGFRAHPATVGLDGSALDAVAVQSRLGLGSLSTTMDPYAAALSASMVAAKQQAMPGFDSHRNTYLIETRNVGQGAE